MSSGGRGATGGFLARVRRVFRYRSAETGKFVARDKAEAHPKTTTRERVRRRESDR